MSARELQEKEVPVQNSYWNRVLEGRVSRRRAIATTGAFGAAAAFLAACGGSDDGGSGGGASGPKDSSGLLAGSCGPWSGESRA